MTTHPRTRTHYPRMKTRGGKRRHHRRQTQQRQLFMHFIALGNAIVEARNAVHFIAMTAATTAATTMTALAEADRKSHDSGESGR